MTTSPLTIELPPTLSQDEARLLLGVKLFEVGKVSVGQAAKIAGFSKRAFLDILARQKIPVFNYTAEDLRDEIGS